MGTQQQFYIYLITPAVTAFGFIINYILTKKSFERELDKKQTDMALNKLVDIPKNILDLFDKIVDNSLDLQQILAEFSNITKTIFAYGSEDSIKILSAMQQHNYTDNNRGEGNPQRLNAYFIILVCQVKFDLTGIKVNPNYWYRLKISDYETNLDMKRAFIEANNEIVRELDLDKFFKI